MDGGRFDLVSAGEGGGRFRSLAIPFGRDVAVVDEGGGFTDDDGGADVSAAVSYTHLTLPTICSV